jgi:shikimate kinase
VPHDKIVDECVEALHARLCGGGSKVEQGTDGMGDVR